MPNHVENDLVIRGDPETLRAFVAYAEGPKGTAVESTETELLSAHRFIPYPEEYQGGPKCEKCGYEAPTTELFATCPTCNTGCKDGYNRGGYDWCIEHWGTKWGLYDVEATDAGFEDGHIGYTFLTAWSPPVPVIQAMSERFPSLRFSLDYFEGGAGFMGSQEYDGGELVEEGSSPYHGDRGG